jgi:uncharacterized protein (TIGR02246 family)
MSTAANKTTEEAQIRDLINRRLETVRSRNATASTASLAPDILSFDVVGPLRRIGLQASQRRAEEWFSSFKGAIDYEIRDLKITAGDDVAFAHGLSHVNALRSDGGQLDMWWRTTVCLTRTDGEWIVQHEHNSVPFHADSGKAATDLKP